jgi:hypothetical protein
MTGTVKQADMAAGVKVGWLTLIEPFKRTLSTGRKVMCWRCKCDCGKNVERCAYNLAKGKGNNCGCKRTHKVRSRLKQDAPRHLQWAVPYTHQPEYRVYRQMLDRCHLECAPNYQFYGAKGVSVCERWRFGMDGMTGFECFATDMGQREDGMTLDRINPFHDYSPDNCRWATWAEQGLNQRRHWAES